VEESHIEGVRAGDQIGAVRNFRLATGAQLREQVRSSSSDHDRAYSYCILDSPIPLIGYVATVRLRRVTDGNRTCWDWRSTFTSPPGLDSALERLVGEEIYEPGFDAIRILVSGQPAPAGAVPWPVRARRQLATRALRRGHRRRRIRWARVLKVREIDAPPPAPGEVQIRHAAIGVNYIDVNIRADATRSLPPLTPGVEPLAR
jgi:hypothetical protein